MKTTILIALDGINFDFDVEVEYVDAEDLAAKQKLIGTKVVKYSMENMRIPCPVKPLANILAKANRKKIDSSEYEEIKDKLIVEIQNGSVDFLISDIIYVLMFVKPHVTKNLLHDYNVLKYHLLEYNGFVKENEL